MQRENTGEKQEMTQRILNGARKVFLEKGYEQTSMGNIAHEINYSPGTLTFISRIRVKFFMNCTEKGFNCCSAI